MMYFLAKLEDQSEIVFSDMIKHNSRDCIKVYVEKPVTGGFQSADCYIPRYEWENVVGFLSDDIKRFQRFIEDRQKFILCYKDSTEAI